MVQGAGRPGQPNIFGAGGGPKFAQMPTYQPVTRAPGEAPQADPQAPYPPQTARPQQPAPAQAQQPAPVQPTAAQPVPAQPAPQAMPPQPAAYQPQQPQPQAFGGQPAAQPQAYTAPSPAAAPSGQELPDLSDADPNFPDSIFGDFKSPEASPPEADFAAPNPAADAGLDAAFPEPVDAGFPEASFPETPAAAGADPALGGGEMAYGASPYDPATQGAAQAPMQQHPGYPPQDYPQQHPAPQAPQAAPGEPGRALQALDPAYDEPPQIPLGGQQGMAPPPQDYAEAGSDADFMDESQLAAAPAGKGSKLKSSLKGRSAVMVASALLGAIALGGALAYAYKQSGGSGEAPMITADATPVKEAPDQPGGKEFPHKNKLIYDRLTNGDQPGSERLVPRQEDVAVPALPPATATHSLPTPVATTDLANQAQAAADGARKVNTFVVRPDGSVEAAAAAAGAVTGAAGAATQTAQDAAGQAAQMAQNATGAATQAANGAAAQAAGQAANMMPVPAPQAAPQQVATANPAPAAAPAAPAADSKYVVQLGSSKSQTDALANFADAQQKYPSLLSSHQPVVRKTDLGAKGTWYRLQVGPLADKSAAYKLCGQLKAKGHADCLVMAQ